MYIGLEVRYCYFCQILINLEYYVQFFSIIKYDVYCKSDQWELFNLDEQREEWTEVPLTESHTEANFANALKRKVSLRLYYDQGADQLGLQPISCVKTSLEYDVN
jgi:hypothetical protein